MGETTGITWTDHAFNPWIGCTAVSAECDNCYAWDLSEFRGWAEWGRGKARHLTKTWPNPPKFNRKVERGDPFTSEWLPPVREGTRRRLVFCASLADVFDAEVPADYRQQLWQLIRKTPNLDWQLLTKRPNLIKRMLPPDLVNAPNIWLGTSVGMQATTWRIPKLLETPPSCIFCRSSRCSVRFRTCRLRESSGSSSAVRAAKACAPPRKNSSGDDSSISTATGGSRSLRVRFGSARSGTSVSRRGCRCSSNNGAARNRSQ